MSFSGSFRNVYRDLWRLSNDRRICNVLSVIVVVAFAAFIVMLVVKGILNFRELSALRQPIRNLGGSVTTSGDGMGISVGHLKSAALRLAYPNASTTVHWLRPFHICGSSRTCDRSV